VIYQRLDVFVLPSDDEQMPLALLEAMAHALPCIATAVGDVPHMLPAAQAPFVVPASEKADAEIAEHLATLAGNQPLRAHLGRSNRAFVAARFDLHGVAATYRRIYHMALSAHGAKVPA
jgi:glycosyltransferase involved in cell wall biosynthesis